MKEIWAWLSRDDKLDRIIAEQKLVLAESKDITQRQQKLHHDAQKGVDSVIRIVNNTWGIK